MLFSKCGAFGIVGIRLVALVTIAAAAPPSPLAADDCKEAVP